MKEFERIFYCARYMVLEMAVGKYAITISDSTYSATVAMKATATKPIMYSRAIVVRKTRQTNLPWFKFK